MNDYEKNLSDWMSFLRSSNGRALLNFLDENIQKLKDDLVEKNDEEKRALCKAYLSIKSEAMMWKQDILDKKEAS